jgi:hypothetical protein
LILKTIKFQNYMKSKIVTFLILLISAFVVTANGETMKLVIQQSDGETTSLGLDNQPVVTFADDNLVAATQNNTFTFPLSNVTQIYYKSSQQHVTVAPGIVGGTITVDNPDATAGETVTVKVTPAPDYQIAKSDIVVEATIDPGSAQVPGLKAEGPDVGLKIELQGDDPADLRTERTYTFTMPEAPLDVLITATFKGVTYYTVTVDPNIENGGVEADKTRAVEGETVTLTVTPATGYELEALTYTAEGGEPVPVENNQFTMPAANVTINATFKAIQYHYSAVEQVKCTVVDASGFAPEGQTITMRVVPESDTQFKEAFVYKVTGHAPNLVEEPIDFTVTPVEGSTKDVDLSFVMPAGEVEAHIICADAYSITVNFGDHGSAQADKIVAIAGETVTVTTYPNQDYKVDEIYYTYTDEGTSYRVDIENGDNGYTFTMPAADVIVVVTFKTIFDYYKLNFNGAPTGGTVSVEAEGIAVNPMDEVAEFSQVRVTLTPAEDYEIESFKVYEGLVSAEDDLTDVQEVPFTFEDGIYRFDMPRTDATIIVSFKAIEHTYTVAGEPAGLFGSESAWNINNENGLMTLEDGVYTWTSEPTALEGNVAFRIVRDNSWDVAYPNGNYNINNIKPGTYTLTVTLNPATGEVTATLNGQVDVYVFGEINGSNEFLPDQGLKMVTEDGKIYTTTVTIGDTEAGYSFFAFTHKLGDWNTANYYRFLAQSDGNFLVNGSTMNVELTMAYNGNNAMKIPAGEYTLTVDMENMKLTIAGGTQLSYILASGVEGVDYTVINDLAVVESSAVTNQFFVSDGADNWIALNAGDYYGNMESLKGGYVSGVFGGKNLNPYLTLSVVPTVGEDVATVNPKTYLLSQEFAPKVDEVIIVSKAYYKATDKALRAYAPGGAQGQSCTVDNSLYSYDFEDGKQYTVKGVINIKEPWATTGGKGLLDYDYPFQNYKLLVTEVTEEPVPTAINGIFLEEGVKSVRFFNAAGVESNVPFQGINIVVKEMNDGSRVTTKIVK